MVVAVVVVDQLNYHPILFSLFFLSVSRSSVEIDWDLSSVGPNPVAKRFR